MLGLRHAPTLYNEVVTTYRAMIPPINAVLVLASARGTTRRASAERAPPPRRLAPREGAGHSPSCACSARRGPERMPSCH